MRRQPCLSLKGNRVKMYALFCLCVCLCCGFEHFQLRGSTEVISDPPKIHSWSIRQRNAINRRWDEAPCQAILMHQKSSGVKENTRCSSWFQKRQRNQDQIASIHWIIEKAREFQKYIYFCFIDYAKAFNCVDHNKLWKILKEMGI